MTLSDPDVKVRIAFVRKLANQEDAAVVPHLLRALQDDDWMVRQDAVKALKRWPQPEVMDALIDVARSEFHDTTRWNAASIVRQMPGFKNRVARLLEDLTASQRDRRLEALSRLARYSALLREQDLSVARAGLMDALGDADPDIRHAATRCLAEADFTAGVKVHADRSAWWVQQARALIRMGSDESAEIRDIAASFLDRLKRNQQSSVAPLVEALELEQPRMLQAMRGHALGAKAGDWKSIERGQAALVFLMHEDETDDSLMLGVESKIGSAWSLVRREQGPYTNAGAIWGGWLETAEEFVAFYKGAKGDPRERQRQEHQQRESRLREQLSEAKDKSDFESFMESASDPAVRDEANQVFASLLNEGDPDVAVLLLTAAARHEQWTMRDKAARALKKMGRSAVPLLLPVLKDSDVAVRWSVAELLGEMGDESAVDGLTVLLEDEEDGVREVATAAIERIRSR